jgi:tryptophanyl-tRNA synthetase
MNDKTRVLTGIQPSGELHLGNYFGAVQPCLHRMAYPGTDLFVFVADYHALTTVHDGNAVRRNSFRLVRDLVALGLDERATLFVQSEVPEVAELTLMLTMVTGMGLLQRAHSYKDKVAKGITPSAGLFIYPVLMAADILLYQTDRVPVGRDQAQHVEMARAMAKHFNEKFGPVFKMPKEVVSELPKVPGLDGQKMSKSYGNTISPFDHGDWLRTKIARIETDSTPYGEPLPTDSTIFELLKLMCLSTEEINDITTFFRTGRQGSQKFGYGHAKKLLAEKIESRFAHARERREALSDGEIMQITSDGAERARRIATKTIEKCRSYCGVG